MSFIMPQSTGFKIRAAKAWPSEFIACVIGRRAENNYEILDIWLPGQLERATASNAKWADALTTASEASARLLALLQQRPGTEREGVQTATSAISLSGDCFLDPTANRCGALSDTGLPR